MKNLTGVKNFVFSIFKNDIIIGTIAQKGESLEEAQSEAEHLLNTYRSPFDRILLETIQEVPDEKIKIKNNNLSDLF